MDSMSHPSQQVFGALHCSSGHLDTRTAATVVGDDLHEGGLASIDLLLIFASYHHRAVLDQAVESLRRMLMPRTLMATTVESAVGGGMELEGRAGFVALALSLPGISLHPWHTTPDDPVPLDDPDAAAGRIGLTDTHRVSLLLADPFTTPITRLIPALSSCGGDQDVPLLGGMASGSSHPGENVLILDDRVFTAGGIGVTISGDITVDFIVSQGARPIGQPMVVTKAEGNKLYELGGKPAISILQDLTENLPPNEQELLKGGMLLGSAIDEHKRPLGRGDFLIRNLLGMDKKEGALLGGEIHRSGQTVQFHVRDAVTATEDLDLLLDAQALKQPPFAGLLFSCNGRGRRLFDKPDHDTARIQRRLGSIPFTGFHAAGEIGPIGNRSYLHGHTAALGLFREREME